MSTHQKILALLEGRDSTRPMRFDDLLEASKLTPATLTLLLDQMANAMPASINRATVTKGSLTQVMVWPTGVIAPSRGSQSIVINPLNSLNLRPQRAELETKPKQTTQETTVNLNMKNKPPKVSATTKAVLDKVIVHPGIDKSSLIKHVLTEVPNTTEVKISSSIGNLMTRNKIHAKGPRGKQTIHPGSAISAPQKTKQAQQAQGASEAPKVDIHQEPTAQAEKTVIPERDLGVYFGLNLDDQDHLHITVGDDDLMLFPEQTQRLHQFLSRIQLGNAA